jgi:hypothetical protein
LKPYNYVKGYARLSRWMDRKWVEQPFAIINICTYFYSTVSLKTRSNKFFSLCPFSDPNSE